MNANNVYTKVLHPVWIDGQQHYYICEYVSMIDVPYKNYILI